MMLIVISEDTFFESWKPTHPEQGPLADVPPGTDPACDWTDCDNGDGSTSIYSGVHLVNRRRHWVTEVPVPAGEEYAVHDAGSAGKSYEIKFLIRVSVTTEASLSEAASRTHIRGAEAVIDPEGQLFAFGIAVDDLAVEFFEADECDDDGEVIDAISK
jgi:hypothetical protein